MWRTKSPPPTCWNRVNWSAKYGGGYYPSLPPSDTPVTGETEKDEKKSGLACTRCSCIGTRERPDEGQTGAGFVNFFSNANCTLICKYHLLLPVLLVTTASCVTTLVEPKGQQILKSTFEVFIWARNRTNHFCISALAL